MLYKLIEIVIEQLSCYCIDASNSKQFRQEVAQVVHGLENIKKYF